MISFHTARLFIRTPFVEDAPMLLSYLLKNREFFQPFIPITHDDFYTLEKQIERIQSNIKGMEDGTRFTFFIFRKEVVDEVIGDLQFSQIIRGVFQSCYLGYKMDEHCNGSGLMVEALVPAIDYIFHVINLHRIEANIIPGNTRSIRVAEKLGFEPEGLSKKYIKINGVWEDHLRYALRDEVPLEL